LKRAVGAIALCDMFFILFLALAGSVSGAFGRVIYYLAYILPIVAMLIVFRTEVKDFISRPSDGAPELTLVSLFPFVGAVVLISYLTSLLLGLFGVTNETDVSGHIIYELLRHALVPAVLEELLFRLIPISLLSRYSGKNAIIISSLLFAFAHCNLFQIPYALIAGAVLGILTLMTGSIIPSLVLHFVNNALSVVMLKYGSHEGVAAAFYISLAVLTLVSVVAFILRRSRYLPRIRACLSGEERLSLPSGAVIFIAMTSVIALINFISLL